MIYNEKLKHHFKLNNHQSRLGFCSTKAVPRLKELYIGLFRGFFMASQHSPFAKSVTPVIYYEYSPKRHSVRMRSHQHHSKWFTAAISVCGLSLAWWLSQSNASYDEQKIEYQVLGFDSARVAAAAAAPSAVFPTLSDVFFNRMSADISDWLKQAEAASVSATADALATAEPAQSPMPAPQSPQASAPASKDSEARRALQASVSAPAEVADELPEALKIPATTTAEPAPVEAAMITTVAKDKDGWQVLTVEKGDTLSNLFSRYEIRRADLYRLLKLKKHKKTLIRLHPGQEIQVKTNAEGHLLALKRKLNYQEDLLIEAADNDLGFAAKLLERPLNTRVVSKAGVIQHSLFADARNAGISSKKILELTRVFNWDIDFSQDLHKGDHFSLVYESIYSDGEYVKDGALLAAEFVNQGARYQAIRYTDPSGHTAYYTPSGHSLQKAFIRNPVKAGHVTSKFNLSRRHPILNKIRAHKGVDYGAPTGTPIYATGKGKVIFAGRKNGYGNTVILQHWDDYTTLYAHMSGFAKDLKVGQKVKQEQIIGYVGQTGLATGPHLHYEFRIKGAHKNPLTVKLPQAIPIEPEYKKDFLAHSEVLMAKLEQATQVALGKNNAANSM